MRQSGITETKIMEIIFEIKVEKIFIRIEGCIDVRTRRITSFWMVYGLGTSMTKIAGIPNISVLSASNSVKLGAQLCTENELKLKKQGRPLLYVG